MTRNGKKMSKLTIAAFSDTHTHNRSVNLPDADVLVFGGDLMGSGYRHEEVRDFASWFCRLQYKYKILVAGNHDRMFESNKDWCLQQFPRGVTYLENESADIEGFKFWGSPVQPWFLDWAFNVHRGAPIKAYWDRIPTDTDVLITHGPPYGILDTSHAGRESLGCEELVKTVEEVVKPAVHIFGHIHGGYGQHVNKNTSFYNVSICDEQYKPVNKPFLIELTK